MSRVLPWLVVLAGACVAIVVGTRLGQRTSEAEEGRRAAEAEALRARGQIVVEQRNRDHVQAEAERLAAQNHELAEALARARRASPGTRPVAVASASTGPVVARGEARTDAGLSPAGSMAVASGGDLGPNGPTGPTNISCLLAAGDTAEIRVGEVVLSTRGGNQVLVGSAQLWRLSPPPESRLLASAFSAPLTTAEVAAPAPAQGWPTWALVSVGVGALLLGGLAGYGAGR